MDDELDAIEQYLESRQDVVDGDYGVPYPNEEMIMLQNIRYERKRKKMNDLTDSYIQTVPDKCDRIVWRGHYYALPTNSQSVPVNTNKVPVAWELEHTPTGNKTIWPMLQQPNGKVNYVARPLTYMSESNVDEKDIDLMRDVYMTSTQRKAYERILAVAKQ